MIALLAWQLEQFGRFIDFAARTLWAIPGARWLDLATCSGSSSRWRSGVCRSSRERG